MSAKAKWRSTRPKVGEPVRHICVEAVRYLDADTVPASIYSHLHPTDIVEHTDGARVVMFARIVGRVNAYICDAYAGCNAEEADILRRLAGEVDTICRAILAGTRGKKRVVPA